jgi:hypothetical protein
MKNYFYVKFKVEQIDTVVSEEFSPLAHSPLNVNLDFGEACRFHGQG